MKRKEDDVDILQLYMDSLPEPMLDTDEQFSYLERIKNGDKEARKEFIERNLRLVIPIAKKYMGYELSFLDLIQEGSLGLMIALDKYDLSMGYKFSTYATWWIHQSIGRGLMEKGNAIKKPVHYQEKLNKIKKAQKEFYSLNGEYATAEELSNTIGMNAKEIEKNMRKEYKMVSLNKRVSADGSDEADNELGDFISSDEMSIEESMIKQDTESNIKGIINNVLSQREVEVLTYRFGLNGEEPLTLEQVGQKYNLTRERIRQIENKAKAKLRNNKSFKKLVDFEEENQPVDSVKVKRKYNKKIQPLR